MIVTKAIKILDWWIDQKKQSVKKLKIKCDDSDDYGITKTLLNADRITMFNQETIRNELVSDCKHPKKMRDISHDG